MIQRHDFALIEDTPEGEFVRYTDHLAALAEKDKEIERLSDLLWGERLSDLLWGARCVFCGEVIGKEKKNQDIADEVLRQHIKSCPKHPLTIARARIKELEHNLEVVKQTKRRER